MALFEPNDRARDLGNLGRLARDAHGDDAPELVHAAGKRQLRAALTDAASAGRSGRRWAWSIAALTLASATAITLLILTRSPAPLAFEVDPRHARGPYLQPAAAGPDANVRFSDGSQLRLASGGRARIASTNPSGAQLVLERGHAELQVVHKPGARWSFDAGPFMVAVTGTRFTLDWHAEDERLEVRVTEGSVFVRSSGRQEGVGVSAGQRLVATARDSRFELGPIATHEVAPAAQEEPAAAPVVPPATVGSAEIPAPSDNDSWSKRVAAGNFAGVLREANQRGLDAVLVQASLADLVALADAARYTADTQVARRALLAQRSRFASSSQARAAAFLIGRIAEDQQRDSTAALGWYDTYLKEAPRGAFAAEALGRKLVLLERSAGPGAAQDTARSYLRRFPDGPYARVAQQVLATP